MYLFSLKNFRGFREQGFVNIKPITLLIGENSAGKSSFLAALKYTLDFISGNEEASFNKDPFQLGTFQQIAHYRGGKAGRAREIQLTIRRAVRPSRKERPSTEQVLTDFSLRFSSSDAQPSISSIEISSNGRKLIISVDNRGFRVRFESSSGEVTNLQDSNDFPRVARSEFSKYWPFLLRELRFRIGRKDRDAQEKLFPSAADQVGEFAQLAELMSRNFSNHVEATSAIRTKPLRTYTPGSEAPDGEGSHVPFEIAKLYRSTSQDSWLSLKNELELFGRSSGMFKEIGVKSFGSSVSDPFQIQFSMEGPKTNIVDLGYGTSQVLPLIYNISSKPKTATHLIQQPEVHLHPKAQAALGEYFIDAHVRHKTNFVLETHSDFIVDRIRQSVAMGKIDSNDVTILFFERHRLENCITEISLDSQGEPVNAPESYRDFFLHEEMRNLGLAEL